MSGLQIGQVCPKCGGETSVVDSRPYLDGVRRRRECKECEYRFSTLEYTVEYIERLRGGDVTVSVQEKAQRYEQLKELLGIE